MNYESRTDTFGALASPLRANDASHVHAARGSGPDAPVRALLRYARSSPRASRIATSDGRSLVADDRQLRHVLKCGLAPLLWRWARDTGATLPTAWSETLQAADLTAQVVYGEICDATVAIVDACRELGVRVTLLKGISIGDQLYPAPHLRPMGDIDLLVAERDRARVEAMLHRRGGVRLAGFREEQGDPHGAPLFLPELRVWVEIHTGLFPEADRLRRNRLFAPGGLERHVVGSTFAGRPVGRLSDELQLVYVASYWLRDWSKQGVHTSFVRPLLDAAYLLSASGRELDWDGLLEWIDNELAAASLYVLLAFLSTRGICAVPPRVLERLGSKQDIVGTVELAILGAMIDGGLVDASPILGRFVERHPMIAQTVLRAMLSGGSHAGKLLSLPWALVFPPWVADRYTFRYHRDRLGRLLRRGM